MSGGAALAAVAAVVALAWPHRPRRVRRPWSAPASMARARRGRRLAALAVTGSVLALAIAPPVVVAVVVAVALRPWWERRRAVLHHRWAVVDALPEAADLLALAVAGGATVPAAVATVARWAPEPVGPAFARAGHDIDHGRPAAEALDVVAADLGGPARPLVSALVASERYGVPLGDALDRLAREARLERRRRAEERARRVPVLLLFPLVLCVLPAFALLTVVPLLVSSLPSLPG